MFGIEGVSKRFIGGTAVAALVLGTGFAAEAAATKKKAIVRHATMDYQGGCGIGVNISGAGVTGAPGACVAGEHYDITRQAREKYLTITVTDQSGVKVGGEIWLSDGTGDAVSQDFCGELKNYRMGQSTYSLDLNVNASTECPSAATTGTIDVTYSSKPVK